MTAYMTGVIVLLAIAILIVQAARVWLRRAKASVGARRNRLWDRFYGLDWGEVTTNNYGYAPADTNGPERFQLQMYREHLKALVTAGRLRVHTDLLEVSCGRGGGLAHLVKIWPNAITATGLDFSENAVAACRERHGDLPDLRFVHGSALALPFPDASFDVVLNVEASNDYGDHRRFFEEVRRVLKPDGVFLYCDTRKVEHIPAVADALRLAGLWGPFRDITEHVLEACRQDSPRRLALLRKRMPWIYWLLFGKDLRSYAAVEGSRKFNAFAVGARRYNMTLATPAPIGEAARGMAARPVLVDMP
jgi:SAM-dependent methyltransferase